VSLVTFGTTLGLIPRLVAAVGFAIVAAGISQNALLAINGAKEHSARHEREARETLAFLAPIVADHAIVGDYASIRALLATQAKRVDIAELAWTDKRGATLRAESSLEEVRAPRWFTYIAPIQAVDASLEVTAANSNYGMLRAVTNPIAATNVLWAQFLDQVQIVVFTVLLTVFVVWLIFRGNLRTLRMLAISAKSFSQGDHTVRVERGGTPEVVFAANAFNEMAANIERLIASLGASERENRRLAAIVKQSCEAIWTRDLEGRITTWNASASQLFGYSVEEAVGNVLPLDNASIDDEEARFNRVGSAYTLVYETTATTKEGTQMELEIAAAPLHDENHQIIGRICVAHDISESKRIQQELSSARIAAEAANEAKSTFLAKMSHEIRTPMNGVLGMTELLLETELTSAQRRFAETVQRSGTSLLGIINDILDFSKIEAGKLTIEHIEFDLQQTIEDTIELLAERAQKKGLELILLLPVDFPRRVLGDPLRLGQVLTNLISNAVKFTDRGEITATITCVVETPQEVELRFAIRDTGPGISSDAQSRIFDNFAQADSSTTRKHGGTGLGLPISKQLIEMMGGRIHVESVPGAGAMFSFELAFQKAPAAPGVPVLVGGNLAGVRTLIVTASAATASVLRTQMGRWDMYHKTVGTSQQALDEVRSAPARGAPYDVFVIDHAVDETGAMDLVDTLRAECALREPRVIMLMPIAQHEELRKARDAGVRACVSKPVRQSALYNAFVTALGQAVRPLPEREERSSDSTPPPLASYRLLVAEDNRVNQQVALGILKSDGHSVTIVGDGTQAVEAYTKSEFDLVLMDCHMPVMDGFEATRRIRDLQRACGSRVPIIALTANAMQQDRDECINAGMDDHLSKPYTRAQMRAMLERWLAHSSSSA